MHDFLASRFVAAHQELWEFDKRHKTFNALTLEQNSFDAIAFALELLKGQPAIEKFLRAVYGTPFQSLITPQPPLSRLPIDDCNAYFGRELDQLPG